MPDPFAALRASTASPRYFVRQLVRDGVLVPFALLRRTVSGGRPMDQQMVAERSYRPLTKD